MLSDYLFAGLVASLPVSGFFAKEVFCREKERTKRTKPQRWSSVKRFLNEGMGFFPSLIW